MATSNVRVCGNNMRFLRLFLLVGLVDGLILQVKELGSLNGSISDYDLRIGNWNRRRTISRPSIQEVINHVAANGGGDKWWGGDVSFSQSSVANAGGRSPPER